MFRTSTKNYFIYNTPNILEHSIILNLESDKVAVRGYNRFSLDLLFFYRNKILYIEVVYQ